MSELLIFAFGVICGATASAWLAWAIWLNQKPAPAPVIHANLVVTPEVLRQVNAAVTLAWLDRQGLTWTAKGAAFNHDKVKK